MIPTDTAPVKRSHLAALAVVCAGAGFLAIWLPWNRAIVAGTTRANNAIDGMQVATLLALPLIGIVVGAIAPRTGWLAAFATVAVFPVLAFADMLRDRTSHNLWPMEFLLYGLLSLLAVGPAFAIGWLRRRTSSAPS